MHRILSISLLAALVFAQGCVHSDPYGEGVGKFAARPANHPVGMFVSMDAPAFLAHAVSGTKVLPVTGHQTSTEWESAFPPGYAEIAAVYSSGYSVIPWRWIIDDAKKSARSIGGDAIVLTGHDEWAPDKRQMTFVVLRRQ